MIRIPENLAPYVDFEENTLVASTDMPPELSKDFEKLKADYEAAKSDPLTEI